jgi:hypothetical protein
MVQEMSGDGEGARIVSKVRRLMMIASLTTFIAVAAVIGVIGYRVFLNEGRVQPAPDVSAPWPIGARVVSSAMNDESYGSGPSPRAVAAAAAGHVKLSADKIRV